MMQTQAKILTTLILLTLFVSACAPSAASTASVETTPSVVTAPANTVPATASPAAVLPAPTVPLPTATAPSVTSAAKLAPVAGRYEFTEGPATDQNGNVYFSDINAGKIYKWSPDGRVTIWRDGLNKPNGLALDASGNLIVCEGGNGRLISINPQGQITALADQYEQKRFNEPNDLWIDPQGGIYFTDPVYQSRIVQAGEYVYYISPDRRQVTRVISDLVRPNGIVGTDDGKTLYVADHGTGQTFVYTINANGTLANKRLFAPVSSDGMTLDAQGNLYLTMSGGVQIYGADGKHLQDIPTPEEPTNVTFAGDKNQTLFITARTAVYTFQMPAAGSSVSNGSVTAPTARGFILSSPAVVEGGALPAQYTCDGASSTLPLAWSGAPAGTQSYAVIMHHVASPEDVHWYWVLYNIPASVTSLIKNSTGIGTLGTNSVNGKTAYSPPCSKGPGAKSYTYTVYALSAQPQLSIPASQVNRDALLKAIQNITLASAELHVTYARP